MIWSQMTSQVTSRTQPTNSQLPLVEEDQFPFAVVDQSFSIQFVHVGHLTSALRPFDLHPEEELTEARGGPGGDVSLRPEEEEKRQNF